MMNTTDDGRIVRKAKNKEIPWAVTVSCSMCQFSFNLLDQHLFTLNRISLGTQARPPDVAEPKIFQESNSKDNLLVYYFSSVLIYY